MIDVVQIQKILPHRYPILLVDRVTKIEEGVIVEGYKNISISDPIFLGHFPNNPIYPGVMIIEGMAQTGAILAFHSSSDDMDISNKVVYFMSIDRAKFRKPVVPGDRLDYQITILKHRKNIWVMDAKAFVDGELVSEAELKAMIADK